MRTLFLLSIFLFSSAFANLCTLKNKLAEAPLNSYIVTEQNKTFTFLHVVSKTETTITLDEIGLPSACRRIPWRMWFEGGATGYTSWTRFRINLVTGYFEEIYSLSRETWVDTSQTDSFLATLLNLSFSPVSYEQRRKVGLPPGYGKKDMRPLWNPRLTLEGEIVKSVPFTAWKARWPSDGSELSNKVIEIYFPENTENTEENYLSFFPYWIEVEGKIANAKLRVVDSGFNVKSPLP